MIESCSFIEGRTSVRALTCGICPVDSANVAPEEHDDIGWFGREEVPPPPHVIVRTALLSAMHSPELRGPM